MDIIHLETVIRAPIDRVFDLTRSIDLQSDANKKARKRAVAGTTSGLIGHGETVTWRARHFGMTSELESKITGMDRPNWFQDIQLKGSFKHIKHDHYFEQQGEDVIMRDVFEYIPPLGPVGLVLNKLFLKNYLKASIGKKNQMIKSLAESDGWKTYLPG